MTAPARSTDPRLAALCAHRAVLAAGAVVAGLGALAAACAPAPGRPGATPRAPASVVRVQSVLTTAGATGPAVPVWAWTREFVDGDPGAAPLSPALTWVAPTGPAAAPSGTVTVRQDPGDGAVAVAARDDDAGLARALAALPADATLVADGPDWLVVTGDRVGPLLPGAAGPGTPAGTVTVAEHRAVLVARRGRSHPSG